jgi:hypothetical protein
MRTGGGRERDREGGDFNFGAAIAIGVGAGVALGAALGNVATDIFVGLLNGHCCHRLP